MLSSSESLQEDTPPIKMTKRFISASTCFAPCCDCREKARLHRARHLLVGTDWFLDGYTMLVEPTVMAGLVHVLLLGVGSLPAFYWFALYVRYLYIAKLSCSFFVQCVALLVVSSVPVRPAKSYSLSVLGCPMCLFDLFV